LELITVKEATEMKVIFHNKGYPSFHCKRTPICLSISRWSAVEDVQCNVTVSWADLVLKLTESLCAC